MKFAPAERFLMTVAVVLLSTFLWLIFCVVIPKLEYQADMDYLWLDLCNGVSFEQSKPAYANYYNKIFPEIHGGKTNSEAVKSFAKKFAVVPEDKTPEEVHKEAIKKMIQIIQAWIKENRPQTQKHDDGVKTRGIMG
ncbi:MAG: hypothetical protein ISS93_02080 [Candidatus Aenigmarchaeota archaeon]|nr:hypothetical protein [Candidatus Aenigmarchaeota archaeon]